MRVTFLTSCSSRRLIAIFSGWATGAWIYGNVRWPGGYDVAIINDYRNPATDAFDLERYDEIVVIGWSMGVTAATLFMVEHRQLPVTLSIAINGTLTPVDDLTGIPAAVFNATLDAISPESMRRFYRRVCGSAAKFRAIESHIPTPDIDALAEELRTVSAIGHRPEMKRLWDIAVVSDSDAIFPTENQLRHWRGHPGLRLHGGSHLPDFQAIVDSCVVDKQLVATRFDSAVSSYVSEATVQRRMAEMLSGMLKNILSGRRPSKMIEIGAGSGVFTRCYADVLAPVELELWDINALNPDLPGTHRVCDAETAIASLAEGSVDVIASAATIQWFNSPTRFVHHCIRALRPGGVAVISTFGPENFRELAPFIGPAGYRSRESWEQYLKTEMAEARVSDTTDTMEFSSTRQLLRHMSRTGVNATISDPSRAARTARDIMRSGITSLTYNPLFIELRKPSTTA